MSGYRPRPRHLCQGCGRTAAWRPGAICSRCQRDEKRDRARQVHERVLELERRRLHPTPAERAELVGRLTGIHERWLAKQTLDHPWRVAREKGAA